MARDPASNERRTQSERRQAAEQALLDAAVRLFSEHGVETTSMADIGAAAGFSRGLANHRFGSRAALVEQLALRVQRSFADAADASGLTGIEALVDLVRRYLRAGSSKGDGAAAFFVMWGASFPRDAQLREVFVQFDRRSRDAIAATVRSGQLSGEIRADLDVDTFAATLLGALRGVLAQHVHAPDAVDVDASARLLEAFIRANLAGADTAAPTSAARSTSQGTTASRRASHRTERSRHA